jgi:hypothetical protein
MRQTSYKLAVLGTLLMATGIAVAQDEDADDAGDSLDLTMVLMPANAQTSDAVTRIIELPPSAGAAGADNAADGLERANQARENREAGLEQASEARENGRDLGQSMRELAQENRENSSRGGGRPENPGRPETPGPPN